MDIQLSNQFLDLTQEQIDLAIRVSTKGFDDSTYVSQKLFETQPPAWDIDDQDDWLAARVVFSEAPFGPFDYRIPVELEPGIRVGMRVTVPLGKSNRAIQGYCIDVINSSHELSETVEPSRLKPILNAVDLKPIIDASLLKLAVWISEYYLCPLGTVIETIVPTGVRDGSGTREVMFLSLADELQGQIDELKTTPKQRAILELLEKGGSDWTARELAETAGCTIAPINNLRKKGWIAASSRRVRTTGHSISSEAREKDLELNADQDRALNSILSVIDKVADLLLDFENLFNRFPVLHTLEIDLVLLVEVPGLEKAENVLLGIGSDRTFFAMPKH